MEPISESLNLNLIASVDELSRNYLLKRFSELWSESEKLIISYDEALDYLNQLFEDDNCL